MYLFIQATSQNLILGFVPESLGLLIFGILLIVLTIALRWLFRRSENGSDVKIEKTVKN